MKKLKKFLRFSTISLIVLVFWLYIGKFLFQIAWNFDIFDKKSYVLLINYWENGGVFNTFRDCTFITALILWPILWLVFSNKLYNYGLGKFLLIPTVKVYRRLTRPKSMEVEHVSIKNMGSKDLSLDEIITARLKEKGEDLSASNVSRNLRQQIAAKIEENEKQ